MGSSGIRLNLRSSIDFVLERLEARQLLSVSFVANPYTTPTNRTDVPLGTMGGFAPIEPFIRVNPTDPANVLPSSHIGTRITTNGGASFAANAFFTNPAGTNTFNGDTGMAFDAAGRCYWTNLAGTGTSGIAVSRINPATGASFVSVAISNNSDDKAFIAADATATSPFANNVYIVWNQFGLANAPVMFSRSINQGVSWSVPIALSGAAETFAWPTSVGVAPNGDVYVAMHANGEGATAGRTLVRRSVDGGVSFAAATEAFTAGQSAMTYNVQTATTTTILGTQFWLQGSLQPWVLPDPSRPGNVYVVTNDDPNNIYQNGDNADVVFARSTDNGATWTRSTISAGPSNSFQIMPTASIDRFGNIVVAWFDNRRGLTNASARFKMDVMATYSRDGGLTWAPEFMVNEAANIFDPDPGAVNRFTGPPPTKRIGEYFGSDLFGGTAHVAWNGNTFSGATPIGQQVWYDSFAIPGVLTVTGDNGGATADSIVVRTLPGNAAWTEVLVNGVREYAGLSEGLTGIVINSGALADTIDIQESAATTSVTVNGGAGLDTVLVNTDATGSAKAIFASPQDLALLQVGAGGRAEAKVGGGNLLQTQTLTLSGSGTLDLFDNDMILDYSGGSQLSTTNARISSARNGGLWNGAGITSSSALAASPQNTTLGAMEATDYDSVYGGGALFDGIDPDNNAVLVKYTYYGDADFSGQVDFDDYVRTDAGYNNGFSGWLNGDNDQSGGVDFDDYVNLDFAYNTQTVVL